MYSAHTLTRSSVFLMRASYLVLRRLILVSYSLRNALSWVFFSSSECDAAAVSAAECAAVACVICESRARSRRAAFVSARLRRTARASAADTALA
jgi:hypothetical protein